MDSDDKKITQLPLVTSLSDSDLLVTVVNIGTAPQTKAIAKSNAITGGGGSAYKNRVINGDFMVAQRGATFDAATTFPNNDDAYTLDRWYLLTDGNDIVDVTQNTANAPTNQQYCIRLDVETVNKKFGIAQIIEKKNLVGILGETVTFSFKAKVSATTNLDNVKAAIVAWSGTADTVTSDIISAWNIEGTNPTLIANATYENTPANLNVTTSWATYTITAAIDTASAANVILFIWSDVTTTSLGEFLYITDVQLENGSTASSFERLPYYEQLHTCEFYFEIIKAEEQYTFFVMGYASSATNGRFVLPYSVKRIAPSISTSNVTAFFVQAASGSNISTTNVSFSYISKKTALISATVASGLTTGQACAFLDNNTGASYIALNSEM